MSTPSLTIDGRMATLTFQRAAKHNALDRATWQALPGLIDEATRAGAHVVILQGSGGHFAAGADIAEFDTVFADRTATLAYLALMSAATAAIEACPLPVIAAIDGLCIGAGVAVALACDIRMATPAARLAITPAKLGLMYSLADTKRVVDAVGPARAKDLLFTARMIAAPEALAIGLIDFIGDAVAVADKARAMAELSSWTHARTKAVVRRIVDGATDDDDETRGWFADAPEGPDFAEGVAAFRARRKPDFPGR
jgi:enoyl-CoA hydratase/carnithine racemase